jgi:hypothetical protein
MLYHGETTLPYGYGAEMTAEQQQLLQAGITGGSQLASALITAFGTAAMTKQQQEYEMAQQRAAYQQERALAKIGGTSGYAPVVTTTAAPASSGIDTNTLLLIAGLGVVAFLLLRKKD